MQRIALLILLVLAAGSRDIENEPPPPEPVPPGTWLDTILATGPAVQVLVTSDEHAYGKLSAQLYERGIALLYVTDDKKLGAAVAWVTQKRGIHPQRVAVVARAPDSVEAIVRQIGGVLLDGEIDAVERNGRTTFDLARGVSLTVGKARGGLYLGLRVRPGRLKPFARKSKMRINGKLLPLPPGGVWGPPGNPIRPPGDSVYEVVIPRDRLAKSVEFAFALDGEHFFGTTLTIRM